MASHMILKSRRLQFDLFALLLGSMLVFFGGLLLPSSLQKVLFNKVEGTSFPFTIQCFMWLLFFISMGELAFRFYMSLQQRKSLKQRYLPDTESEQHRVLTVEDMGDVYRNLKTVPTELAELISNLALRFQAGKSVEQTHELLSSQLELWQFRLDLDYNIVRYVSWLIPTVGFIGTVVGISQALNFAGSGAIDPESPEFLPAVTSQLGLAFDTTLLALIMSSFVVFFTHVIQESEERGVEAAGRYCLDNLITRLYTNK